MIAPRFRYSVVALLVVVGAVFVVGSWWCLQQSNCAGDLKIGSGDITKASSLEERAFLVHLAGVVALLAAVLVHYFGRVKYFWLRTGALLASSPVVASLSFLGMALFSGHVASVCVNGL